MPLHYEALQDWLRDLQIDVEKAARTLVAHVHGGYIPLYETRLIEEVLYVKRVPRGYFVILPTGEIGTTSGLDLSDFQIGATIRQLQKICTTLDSWTLAAYRSRFDADTPNPDV